MTTQIIKCTKEDIETLRDLSIQTFSETFSEQNDADTMEEYLKTNLSQTKLMAELSHPDSHFYFLINKNENIGYLKVNLNHAQTEQMGDDSLEVERIYLKYEYQGNGFGKILIQHAEKLAKEFNKSQIWLGVWEHNQQAIRFYQKLGFTQVGQHSFFMGSEEQIDFMMAKEL